MTITSRGFQFLLEEVNTQLWGLLLKYLELAEVCRIVHWFYLLIQVA